MNILGFVSGILIIFSIIASYMLKTHKDTNHLKNSMKGYYSVNNRLKTDFEEHLYDIYHQNNYIKKTNSSNSQGNIITRAKRPPKAETSEPIDKDPNNDTKVIHECGCINISSLIKFKDSKMSEVFAKLLKLLYGKEFSNKNQESNFTTKFLKLCENKKIKNEEIHFEKLNFKDPYFQELWFKMLKGTKDYDFEKKIGYPSILEFITISNSVKNAICINSASEELLSVLFNEKISQEIKKKKSTTTKITKDDLEKIIKKTHSNIKDQSLVFFNHSDKHHKYTIKSISSKNKNTQIVLRKKL